MRFKDRKEAGGKLAAALARYSGATDAVVAALPRGGAVLGRVAADALALPLDLVVPRKLGAPGNPEYAIGALAEHGEAVWNEGERRIYDEGVLERLVAQEREESLRRLRTYRGALPPRDLSGKTVILVDDGVATGYTMRAAIRTARREGAARVVVAVPVAAPDAVELLKDEADEVIVLTAPEAFFAIGDFYDEFPQVSDEEVLRLMRPS